MTLPSALRPSSPPSATTSPEPSPALKALLEREPEAETAVRRISETPALLDETKALLPVLRQAAVAPAGEAGVRSVIGKRFALYPQAERDDGEWAAWWSDYYDALADLPLPALEAGMVRWVRDPESRFLPMPGKLRELALTTENRPAMALHRARWAIDRATTMAAESGEKVQIDARALLGAKAVKPIPRADAKRAASEFAARVEATQPPPAPMPLPRDLDEHGVSSRMRDVMAKRSGS